jgi:hypothetical protein
MGSFPNWFRVAPLVRTQSSVFAVGRRVYVSCAGDPLAQVALTDDRGADARTGLADGTEVEILAWRPRKSHGTRYRVRATRDGLEGWLAVDNLRNNPRLPSQPPLRPRRQPQVLRRCARWHPGIPGVGSATVWADNDGIEGNGRGRSRDMTSVRIARGPVNT